MGTMASQMTRITIVYPTVFPGANQRKHQSSASQAFVRGIHRWPVNSLHKGLVTRKMFPFDNVIMCCPFDITGLINDIQSMWPSHYKIQGWHVVNYTLQNRKVVSFSIKKTLKKEKCLLNVCAEWIHVLGNRVLKVISPWCRVYAFVNWVSIGSGNGLSSVRCQAITWTNADLLSVGPLGTNFSEILIEIQAFSSKKRHMKMSSAIFRQIVQGEMG